MPPDDPAPAGGTNPSGGNNPDPAKPGGGDPPSGGQPEGGDKTFTQDQVNAVLARERRGWQEKYGDEETLRKAKEFDALQESQRTETEKLQSKATEAEKRSTTLESDLKDVRLELAVERQAAKMGIVDPEAACKLIDRSALEFGDDGVPKPESVKTQLEELSKSRSWLFGKGRPSGSADGGSRQPAGGGDDDMNSSIRHMARRS